MDNKFNHFNTTEISGGGVSQEKILIPLKVKQFLLEQIDHLLNNYSNEIPQKIIHSTEISDGSKDYKVRMAWFSSIMILLTGIGKKYLPKEFNDEVFELLVHVKMVEPTPDHKGDSVHITTKDEIDKADELLRRARGLVDDLKTL